jgi:cytochrome oxidase Cu insertion factor (SCO1/SenC/PrrC family)
MNKRATLIILALLFFGPMAIAWTWFFWFQDVRPGTINKGDLVQPPVVIGDVRLPERGKDTMAAPFAGDWSVVVLAPVACGEACERALYVTRQVWIRLNRDSDRVQRILLAGPGVEYPAHEHRDLRAFDATDSALARFDSPDSDELAGANRIYLVDPYGNLMMSYPLDFTPEMLNSDLKRLLKISEADKSQ